MSRPHLSCFGLPGLVILPNQKPLFFMSDISPLRQFEMERDERIRSQNVESAKKHEQLLAQAEEYRTQQSKDRSDLIEQRKRENKEKQEHLKHEDDDAESPWENVVKYCDIKVEENETEEKEKDTTRLGKLYRRLKAEKHK
jgi:hypothetical protein